VTTVVELGQRSSAIVIARAAHDLGGVVVGVPGSIYSATSMFALQCKGWRRYRDDPYPAADSLRHS
jgi:hypothetical protein